MNSQLKCAAISSVLALMAMTIPGEAAKRVSQDGISCRQGRSIVDQRFNQVQTVECSGGTFTYVGRRNGEKYRVIVSSRSGNIISVNEI